uniref:Purple acid phosphatase n=1 Tax=Aureoumbra lagunensis TaxID=44058 RepID=A0A7S3JWM7_9STRA
MIVTWAMNSSSSSVVRYWRRKLGEDSDESIAFPYWIRQYNVSQGVRIVHDYVSPWFYSAKLGPLQKGSFYEYQIDNGTRHFFETISEEKYPITVAILGDVGQTNFSKETFNELEQYEPRPKSVLLLGDLSYADGELDRWDSYERLAEKAFAEIPVAVLPGNHECEVDSTGNAFTSYRNRYPPSGIEAPEIIAPGNFDYSEYDAIFHYDFGASFYAYTLGPVKVIALNTYVRANAGSRQQAFLERELACTDRSVTPWIIIGMHAPWYSTNAKHRADTELNTANHRAGLEDIIAQGGVAFVFAGHVHAYERSHAVCQNELDNKCPVYITVGDGGNRELLYDAWPFANKYEPWSAYRNGTRYGFGVIDFHSDYRATWKWLPNDFNGEPRDSIEITNPYFATVPEQSFSLSPEFTFDCQANLVHEVNRRAAFSSANNYDSTPDKGKSIKSRQMLLIGIFCCLLFIVIATTFHAFHNAVDHPHFSVLTNSELELVPSSTTTYPKSEQESALV